LSEGGGARHRGSGLGRKGREGEAGEDALKKKTHRRVGKKNQATKKSPTGNEERARKHIIATLQTTSPTSLLNAHRPSAASKSDSATPRSSRLVREGQNPNSRGKRPKAVGSKKGKWAASCLYSWACRTPGGGRKTTRHRSYEKSSEDYLHEKNQERIRMKKIGRDLAERKEIEDIRAGAGSTPEKIRNTTYKKRNKNQPKRKRTKLKSWRSK